VITFKNLQDSAAPGSERYILTYFFLLSRNQ